MRLFSECSNLFDVDQYNANGIAVLRSFFTEDDVALFNEIGREKKEFPDPALNYVSMHSSLVNSERFYQLIISTKIVRLASHLLKSTPVYFGHLSPWHRSGSSDLVGGVSLADQEEVRRIVPPYEAKAHIDAKGRDDNLFGVRHGIPELYPVLRLAWFPQSFRDRSLAMRIYPGTHVNGLATPETEALYLDVESTDLVIFNLKTIHSALSLLPAESRLLAEDLWRLTPEKEVDYLRTRPELFRPAPTTRNSIFWDFGDQSRVSELFIRNRAVLNTAEEIYREMYATDLFRSLHLTNLHNSGNLIVREDLRYVYLRRSNKFSTDNLRYVAAIRERIDLTSNVPIENDLRLAETAKLERSGSKTWQ